MLFRYTFLKYAYQEKHICGADFTKHNPSFDFVPNGDAWAQIGSDWMIHALFQYLEDPLPPERREAL